MGGGPLIRAPDTADAAGGTASPAAAQVRATFALLDGKGLDEEGAVLETVEAAWNPSSYRLHCVSRSAAGAVFSRSAAAASREPPAASRSWASPPMPTAPTEERPPAGERLSTELFFDTTGESGELRDARRAARRLRRWMEPLEDTFLPPRVLFVWGPLRFVGSIEALEEEWVRFDPDGTPVRGSVRLTLWTGP